ncbi:hypothetical protein QQM41_03470 [Acetobacter sp. AC2005]|uniref:hypothetical protein n=1 Tax=Acetobacter sp. AC2005 TaxID=3134142 RepID=UPI0030D02D07
MPRYQATLTRNQAGRYQGTVTDQRTGNQIEFSDCSKERKEGRWIVSGKSTTPSLPEWFLEMRKVDDGLFEITATEDRNFLIRFPECEPDEIDGQSGIIGWADDVQLIEARKERAA